MALQHSITKPLDIKHIFYIHTDMGETNYGQPAKKDNNLDKLSL